MKPKTSLQKKVVALSKAVKPITKKQERWAQQRCFGRFFVRVRNRNNCLECGHKWKPDMSLLAETIVMPSCPNCRAKNLTHVDNWDSKFTQYEYYAKIEVIQGFQLVRMFRIRKYMKCKQPAQFDHIEAMQHFIREDGASESLQRLGQGMGSHYIDSWVHGSRLEVRIKSTNYHQRNTLVPYKILPGRQVLPVLRRNGYRGHFYKHSPHDFFKVILLHPAAETLLKAGQIDLFSELAMRGRVHTCEERWGSICIAMRNNYYVKDAQLWLDYLNMLDRFGKDTLNAHYVCPGDLNKEHNRYNAKIEAINRRQRLEEKKKDIEEANLAYVQSKKMFFDLHIQTNDLDITPLKSVEEFFIEGEKLKHCLFNNKYYNRDESLILSVRKDGEPVYTVEVDLNHYTVAQARGRENQSIEKYHKVVIDAVQANMNKIASKRETMEVLG